MYLSRSLTCTALLVSLCLPAIAQEAWEKTLEKRAQDLETQNGNGTDAALRTKLLAMRHEDQAARFANIQSTTDKKPTSANDLLALDRKLTAELKEIVATHGWPTIHMVGYDASNGAMLLLTHSPDHAWQRSLIPQLETLVQENKIDGSQLALVVDKELVAEGKPQRYGTQFKFVDGQAMMFAVEDPAHLDQRREAALLPPMSAYKKMLGDMYHMPVSDVIVRPDAPKR